MTSKLDAASLFRVDGMVAAITGGGTGIGLTMARALATNGARRVYLLGRRRVVLEEAAKEFPGVFRAVPCDVTSRESLQSAVTSIEADEGFVNLLVVNAGAPGPLEGGWKPERSVSELREAMFSGAVLGAMTQTFEVNVTGAFATMVAFLELLDAGNKRALLEEGHYGAAPVFGRAGGDDRSTPAVQSQIIVTSSIAAFSRMHMSSPSYASSKAAVLHLAKQASTNLARFGIRVNALAPGLFPTELAKSLIQDRDPSKEGPNDPRFIPAGRFGGDEEMAGTVLYLASRAGSFCNGMVLVNDGGRLAVMLSSY